MQGMHETYLCAAGTANFIVLEAWGLLGTIRALRALLANPFKAHNKGLLKVITVIALEIFT